MQTTSISTDNSSGPRACGLPEVLWWYATDHHERRPFADGAGFCAAEVRCVLRRGGRLEIVDRSECEKGSGDQAPSTRSAATFRSTHGLEDRLHSPERIRRRLPEARSR